LVAAAVLVPHTAAQSLPISLFERYLESLRQQAGIPGLSAAIVQGRQPVWDNGFGYQDVEALIRATATTPYPIEDLSQTLASTLLLQRCLDSGRLELDDRVRRWSSGFPEESTTVGQLLRHMSPSGGFEYDTARYSLLSTVIEQCAAQRYPRAITDEILDRLRMEDSVPSHDYTEYRSILTDSLLARYSRTLQRLAMPYRVDGSRRPVRSEYKPRRVNGSTGVVSTARDLARFDMALADGLLASRGVDAEVARRFRACLERCDFARFVPDAAQSARKEEVLGEAEDLVERLERAL
jgi:CubicO group peptidase (beta-lactamase class C family)